MEDEVNGVMDNVQEWEEVEFSVDSGELLERLSDIGITLLLFTIGLKLQPAKLLRTQVWGTAAIQTGLTLLFFALVLMAADGVLAVIDLKLQTLLTKIQKARDKKAASEQMPQPSPQRNKPPQTQVKAKATPSRMKPPKV